MLMIAGESDEPSGLVTKDNLAEVLNTCLQVVFRSNLNVAEVGRPVFGSRISVFQNHQWECTGVRQVHLQQHLH